MNRKSLAILILTIILAIIFRIPGLSRKIWVDEIFTIGTLPVNIFRNPFFWGIEIHQPLYFYYLKFWNFILAPFELNTTFWFRFSSSLLSTIGIIFIFSKFTKIKSLKFSTIFAILIAITPIQIYYSQELRPYYLLTILILMQLHYLFRIVNEDHNIKAHLRAFAILGIASLLTHLVAMFLFTSYLAIGIIYARKNNAYKTFLLINLGLLLLAGGLMFATRINPMYEISQGSFTPYVSEFKGIESFKELSITLAFKRFKEVLTSYFWFGHSYYIISPQVQFVVKKLLFFIVALASVTPFLKKESSQGDRVIVATLYITLIQIYLTEKFGLFPFGGRYIMPFSILLLYTVANFISNANKKIIITIFIPCLIGISLLFFFHEVCYNKLLDNGVDLSVNQSSSYSQCRKDYSIR